jgi:hypothetical protein
MRTRTYAITVNGRLSERFAAAFENTRVEAVPGAQTRLVTDPFDQSQLKGLLDHLASLGFELVRVEEVLP